MTLLTLLKEFAFEAGKGAVTAVVELVRGKPKDDPAARGLSHRDVERQQAQIKSATSHKVPPRVPPRPRD